MTKFKIIQWFKNWFVKKPKETKKVKTKVPEGMIIFRNSRHMSNLKLEFFYENGLWYGYGTERKKLLETPFMQDSLTNEYLNN